MTREKRWKRGIGNDSHYVYDGDGHLMATTIRAEDGTTIVNAVNTDAALRERVQELEEDHRRLGVLYQGTVQAHEQHLATLTTAHDRLTHEVQKWQQKFAYTDNTLCELQKALQQAVEALAERDAKIVMLYEEIGHKDSRIKAFQIAIDGTGKWGGGT